MSTTPEQFAKKLFLLAERSRGSRTLEVYRDPQCMGFDVELERNGILICITARGSSHENGNSHIVVTKEGDIVLEATGEYISQPRNLKIDIYVPGEWEEYFK